jgi:hypothetical protein
MRRWTKESKRVHLFNLDLTASGGAASFSQTTCVEEGPHSHSSRVVRLLDFRAECNRLSYSIRDVASRMMLIFMLTMSCLFVESSHHILG